MSDNVLVRGTTEYLYVTVTANATLDTQPIAVSFDKTNWITASWVGTAGTTRKARVLVSDLNLPAKGSASVYVKITNMPEIPVRKAGRISII